MKEAIENRFDDFSEAYNRLTTEMTKKDIPIDFLDTVLEKGRELIRTTFAPP